MKTKIQNVVLLGSAILLLGGCSTYKEKFKASSTANVGYFADSTVSMLGTLDLQLGRNELLLSRRFFEMETGAEELKVIAHENQFDAAIRGLVEYSIKIVNIAESGRTE